MEKYTVIIIQGYNRINQTGTLEDVVTIELMENDVDKAIERAKQYIGKPFYRVSNIIENYVKP